MEYKSTREGIVMALTESTMLSLGTEAPEFQLPDHVTGDTVGIDTFAGEKGLLVMFICNHCPFVKHVQDELARLGKDYADKSLGIVAITSNDVPNFPDDSPEKSKQLAEKLGFTFPYCYDESQEIAKAYTAACTPDFFLFDESRKLTYRGQLDDSRPENGKPITGSDLRGAIDAVLAGQPVITDQKPSVGCNIKWKVGNEPAYFG